MSSLKINEHVSRSEYVRILDAIYFEARAKVKPNEALLANISALIDYGKEVASFAHEYDFDGVQANGYWSLLRICIKYLNYGLKHYENHNNKSKFNRQFESLVASFVNGCQCIKTLREDSLKQGLSSKESEASLPLPLQTSDMGLMYKYFNDILTADFEKWEPFADQFAGCYHNAFFRLSTYFIFNVVSLLGTSRIDMVRFFSSSDFRHRKLIQLVKKFDSAVIILLSAFGDASNVKLSHIYLHGLQPEVTRTVFIKRQKKYLVDYSMEDKKIFLTNESPISKWGQKRVRCRLLYRPAQKHATQDSLVLHCHGGGFITGSPDSHEIYTRGWAKEMPGVPILSIDHSLSPKHKFPVASQQILDVYLWLISGDPGVKRMLSFHPKRILLTGDSSGGLLMMILMITLNDIRKQFNDPSIILPTSFVGFYTSFTLEPKLSPAFILSCFHTFLFPTVFTNMVDDYLPDGRRPSASYGVESLFPKVVTDLWSSFTYVFQRIAWYWKMYFNMYSNLDPWFTRGEKGIEEKLLKDLNFTRHPYLSPLNYDDFESLSHIPIHLISIPFEPTLDQTVMMAKKWKGPVKVEIYGELLHGFLNFAGFGGQYKEASKFAVQRIKDGLLIK